MPRTGLRRSSSVPRSRPARRLALSTEMLESRQLLSATTSNTTITPAIAADRGGFPGGGFPGFPGGSSGGITNPTPVSSALTPAQLAAAYSINQSSTTGSGETIAIVDAYNDPNIAADLAVFDSEYHLAAASLTVENEYGSTSSLPATSADWSLEIALDVEYAHAAAPGAKIILVEANSASTSDLMTAVQTAAKQANVVSMSWGGSEWSGETAYDTAAYFANPNVTFVAASGDSGTSTAEWPAVSPEVVSVGGTTLTLTSSGSIASETAWSGSTGGKSLYESEPSYQVSTLGSTGKRETPDVASVANPNTGLSVYDSVAGTGQTGWFEVGGTSAGAPVWAGIIAAADQARAAVGKAALGSTQTLALLYSLDSSSTYSTDFHDVTGGSNARTAAARNYDMVTGLGSPVASKIVAAAAASTATTSAVKATAPAGSTTRTKLLTVRDVLGSSAVAGTSTGTSSTATTSTVIAAPVASSASTTTAAASFTAATTLTITTSAPAPPAQLLASPSLIPTDSSDDPVAPTDATAAGEKTSPEPARNAPAAMPAPADPSQDLPYWDAAMEGDFLDEATEPAPAPAVDEETEGRLESPVPNPLALIAGAAFVWGTWEYRARRGEGDRRRRIVSPVPPSFH